MRGLAVVSDRSIGVNTAAQYYAPAIHVQAVTQANAKDEESCEAVLFPDEIRWRAGDRPSELMCDSSLVLFYSLTGRTSITLMPQAASGDIRRG
jgi:hypothetical protein